MKCFIISKFINPSTWLKSAPLFVFYIPNVYVPFLVRNVYDVLIRKNNRTKGVLLW